MADDVRPNQAAFVVHPTMELALTEARNIKASQVRIVTLYPPMTLSTELPTAIGYACVPTEHACFACSQQVTTFDASKES